MVALIPQTDVFDLTQPARWTAYPNRQSAPLDAFADVIQSERWIGVTARRGLHAYGGHKQPEWTVLFGTMSDVVDALDAHGSAIWDDLDPAPRPFLSPGSRVWWRREYRGGYGYVIPHPAVVVRRTANRVRICIPRSDGTTEERTVRPDHLSPRATPCRHEAALEVAP